MNHLHLDHAGGLYHFDGTDVPVYVHRRELEFAYLSAKTDVGSVAYWAPAFDRDLNWHVVEGDRQLYEGFDLLHLPGHTPGLLGATVEAGDDTLLVAGDEVSIAANYEAGQSMASSLLWETGCGRRAWSGSGTSSGGRVRTSSSVTTR